MGATANVPDIDDVLAGKYVLRERLGEGGMGQVFRADQPELGRSVAIKMLHPRWIGDAWSTRKFCDEAAAASCVKHPGAVSVLEYDLTGELPFIVMEHVPGYTLGCLLGEEEVPVSRALAIVDQILDVLDAVHAAGIVHADLKCDNVLVEPRAEGDVVTVIDFGLARFDGPWCEAEVVSGTPEYMAPELIRGEPPTPASDLYGVAVILYELLTGETPFAGGSPADVFTRQLHDRVTQPSLRRCTADLPAELDEIVLRALSKDPGARFAGARELQLVLRSVAAGEPAMPHRRGAPGAAPAHPPSRTCLARGSDARAFAERGDDTREPQRAIVRALLEGDVAGIASGYLALAEALERDRRPEDALRELEEGIDVLAAGYADHAREGHRLVVALATLSRRLGRDRRASRRRAEVATSDTLLDVLDRPDHRAAA